MAEDASVVDDSLAERCRERQLLEIEALEAIYGTDRFTVVSAAVEAGSNIRCRLELSPATLHLTLPPGYPEAAAPQASVVCAALDNAASRDINASLAATGRVHTIESADGQECLYQLASELEEKLGARLAAAAEEKDAAASTTPEDERPLSQVLLFIDHMNDSTTYLKKVDGWASDLGLTGLILYRMRTKPVNATSAGASVNPKGRAEDIFVFLESRGEDGTRDFLTRLRTSKMTSQDRHERKSTVLWNRLLSEEEEEEPEKRDVVEGCAGVGARAGAAGQPSISVPQRALDSFTWSLYTSREELQLAWKTAGLEAIVKLADYSKAVAGRN